MLSAIPGKTKAQKLENCWERLQKHVNLVFDSDSLAKGGEDVAEKCPGIKQKLEKKNGESVLCASRYLDREEVRLVHTTGCMRN